MKEVKEQPLVERTYRERLMDLEAQLAKDLDASRLSIADICYVLDILKLKLQMSVLSVEQKERTTNRVEAT